MPGNYKPKNPNSQPYIPKHMKPSVPELDDMMREKARQEHLKGVADGSIVCDDVFACEYCLPF